MAKTLDQEVRSEDSWTLSLLTGRQERLVGVLQAHWDLEGAFENKTADAEAKILIDGVDHE